jgi:hypothetical protein
VVLYEISIVLAAVIRRRADPGSDGGQLADAAAITMLLGMRARQTAGPRLVRS